MSRPGTQDLGGAVAPDVAHSAARPANLFAAGGRYVRRLWSSYWENHTRRATMAVLNSLSDRALKDIGLHRSEIGSLVYGTRRDRRV